MKKNFFFLCIIFTGIILMSCSSNSNINNVDVIELKKGDVKKTIDLSGIIESEIHPQVVTTDYTNKKVKRVCVDIGNIVKVGDVLVEFEDDKILCEQEGVVSAIYAEPGYECSDGRVIEIRDDKLLKGILYVEDDYINDLEIGQKVVINSCSNENNECFGMVERIAMLKDSEKDGFRVVVSLERPQKYKLGEEIDTKITINTWKDVYVVNNGSVMRNKDDCYVLVASKNEDGSYSLKKNNIMNVYDGDDCLGIEEVSLNEGDYIVKEVYNYEPEMRVIIEVEE